MPENNAKPVYRIMDLHEADRPRERPASLGPQALTNVELIAILLRVGVKGENAVEVGQRLLNKFGGLTGLHRAPFVDLKNSTDSAMPKRRRSKPLLSLVAALRLILLKNAQRSTPLLMRRRWSRMKCPHWSRNTCA